MALAAFHLGIHGVKGSRAASLAPATPRPEFVRVRRAPSTAARARYDRAPAGIHARRRMVRLDAAAFAAQAFARVAGDAGNRRAGGGVAGVAKHRMPGGTRLLSSLHRRRA